MDFLLTFLSFFGGMALGAFVDLSVTGDKLTTASRAAERRNKSGFWIGYAAFMICVLAVNWVFNPISFAYMAVAYTGVGVYKVLTHIFKKRSPEGDDA